MAVKPSRFAKARRSKQTLVQTPPEKKEALWLIEWAYSQPLLRDTILHIANEGKRPAHVGRDLKLMGLRKGVSDYFIPIPRKGYHGLWIELKPMYGGKVTKEQAEWLDRMRGLGYAGYVAHGWVEAAEILTSYLR